MIAELPNNTSKIEELQPFGEVVFIVSDIDGTIVAGDKEILNQISKKADRLRRAGVQLTVATGRTLRGAKDIIKQLGIKETIPIALYNGSLIVENNTSNVIFMANILQEDVKKIFNAAINQYVNIYYYVLEKELNPLSGNPGGFVEKVYAKGNQDRKKDVNGTEIQWIREYQEIEKEEVITILVESLGLDRFQRNTLLSELDTIEEVSYTDSGSGFIEIRNRRANKGLIFNILKDKYLCPYGKFLAIGDNDNDLELFEAADISVVVYNASKAAINSAEYICANESAAGFYDLLTLIDNAKRYR